MQFQLEQYQLQIKKTARRGSIALKVTPNEIALMVPKGLCDRTLQALVSTQQQWLLEKIHEQQSKLPTARQVAHGANLLLFGNEIGFALDKKTPVTKMGYQFEDNALTVFTQTKRPLKDPQPAIRKQLAAFYTASLDSFVQQNLPGLAKQIGVEPSEIAIKNYKSRWGSCYADGRIQFNWRLAMAPAEVVEYVIIHELCHLIHQNHSKQYWQLVEQHCPQMQQHKAWLKEHGQALIHF